MSNYDECLDLLVEYFNKSYKNYYTYTSEYTELDEDWDEMVGAIVKKIEKLPDNKLIPAFLHVKKDDYYELLENITVAIVDAAKSYTRGVNYYRDYQDYKFKFYKSNDKLFLAFSLDDDDKIYEIRFKKSKKRSEFSKYNFISTSNIIISVDDASAILGLPVFDMDNTIIDKLYSDIINYVEMNNNVGYYMINSFVSKRLHRYVLENVHNKLYNVNTRAVKNILEGTYSPNKIVNKAGESSTMFVYLGEEAFIDLYVLQYSLQGTENWFVTTNVNDIRVSYDLTCANDKSHAKLEFVYTLKDHYLYQGNNGKYVISDVKPDVKSQSLQIPDRVAYSFCYSEQP